MRTLDRYLAGIFIRNFSFLFSRLPPFIFSGLIGELVDHAYPPQQILWDHLLSLPDVLVMMVPPSTILATVLTLSGLTRTNELVACFFLSASDFEESSI